MMPGLINYSDCAADSIKAARTTHAGERFAEMIV